MPDIHSQRCHRISQDELIIQINIRVAVSIALEPSHRVPHQHVGWLGAEMRHSISVQECHASENAQNKLNNPTIGIGIT